MFREMRRKERALSREEAVEILSRCDYGILSTMGDNGYPYGVPVDYTYHNNCIYFHCAVTGQKLDHIEKDCHVSFCVVSDVVVLPEQFSTKFMSVILFGQAQEVFDDEKKQSLMLLLKKFSCDFMEAGEKYIDTAIQKTRVFKIEINHMTGKGK